MAERIAFRFSQTPRGCTVWAIMPNGRRDTVRFIDSQISGMTKARDWVRTKSLQYRNAWESSGRQLELDIPVELHRSTESRSICLTVEMWEEFQAAARFRSKSLSQWISEACQEKLERTRRTGR